MFSRKLMFAAIVSLALASCNTQEDIGDAQAAISSYQADFNDQQYKAIWDEGAPMLFEASTEEKFTSFLENVRETMGKVVESTQVGWNVQANLNGNFVVITMDTKFENGAGQEVYTLQKNNDMIELVGYNLNSDDFMRIVMEQAAETRNASAE